MLRIRNARLPQAARDLLTQYQAEVDAAGAYAQRVASAKSRFSQRNTATNAAFIDVRRKLTEMCNGARRCMYCEDSVADEVEHFKPKDLYPEVVFAWSNYLYACGPCNGPKNNQFSIVDTSTGGLIDVTRPRNAPIVAPVVGDAALIDPRREDPLVFLMLDLRDTFEFTPIHDPNTREYRRAEYTITVLRLNARDYLIQARENAYGGFRARLSEYIQRRDAGASARELALLKRGIQRAPHPTVWSEMKRQNGDLHEISGLFAQAPEALNF